MDSKAFYDEYADRQLAVGVNERHHAILHWLKRFGLNQGNRVLEIGCGVGTLTSLIVPAIGPKGSLLAVDLSTRSIGAARERLARFRNVHFVAGDILELSMPNRFDVIALPDVIEHIPVELHPALFSKVASWVEPNGFVLLHYPNPYYLEWCRVHRPELLQIVDQSIHVDTLTANAYPHDLHLCFFETYSIWTREGEYQVAILRRNPERPNFTDVESDPRFLDRLRRLVTKLVK